MTARIVSVGDSSVCQGKISGTVDDGVLVKILISAADLEALKILSKRSRKTVPEHIRMAIKHLLQTARV